jgi:YVTN family beta-propeller protein
MMIQENIFSKGRKIIATALIIVAAAAMFYISTIHAAPVTYYFNNAVDQSPAEQGNYWYDAGFTQPALELPDFNVDIVYVTAGAVFAGEARFNGAATNEGQVTGNASFYDTSANNAQIDGDASFYQNATHTGIINGSAFFYDSSIDDGGQVMTDATFYNDLSENIGNKGSNQVSGTQTRYYNQATTTVRDFVTLGPWTVVADGVEVDVTGATFDGTTTFSAINSGSFVGVDVATTYYFNNAVNTDPTEVGNYWLDADCTVPASVTPNFSTDEVFIGGCSNWSSEVIFNGDATLNVNATNKGTITGTATFNDSSQNYFSGFGGSGQGIVQGTAIFNDSSANVSTVEANAEFHNSTQNAPDTGIVEGNAEFYDTAVNGGTIMGNATFTDNSQNGATINGNATFNGNSLLASGVVEGDATFNGDLSDIQSHGGSVSGTKTRRYSSDTTTTRDFRSFWTVLADGAVVTITDALINENTTLQTLNGGSFFSAPPILSSSTIHGKTLTLSYNRSLDTASVPATSDYHLTRNGIDEAISNVSISNMDVILTINSSKAVTNDTFVLDYTAGATPLQGTAGSDAANLVDRAITVSLTFIVGTSPTESIAVANKVYILNNNNIAVLDPETDAISTTIAINGGSKAVLLGTKLYVARSVSSPGLVSVINTLTDTVSTNINTVNSPNNIILVGTKLYVLPASNSSITVIDTNTDTVVATIALGAVPASPVVVGRKLYVTNQVAGTVKEIFKQFQMEMGVGSNDSAPKPEASKTIGMKERN